MPGLELEGFVYWFKVLWIQFSREFFDFCIGWEEVRIFL